MFEESLVRVATLSRRVVPRNLMIPPRAGGSKTSESTAIALNTMGESALILLYVDDVLLAGNVIFCEYVITALEKKYETKRTDKLRPSEIGEMSFLGRAISKTTKDDPCALGLPPAYYTKHVFNHIPSIIHH